MGTGNKGHVGKLHSWPQATGKPSNNRRNFNELFEDALIEHFARLRTEAGSMATHFVRKETGGCLLEMTTMRLSTLMPVFLSMPVMGE